MRSDGRMRALLAGVAVGIVLLAVVTIAVSCSRDDDQADPPVWGPTVAGQVYCGYWYDPAECIGRAGMPVMFPHTPPTVHSGLSWLLWAHYCAYHGYYTSPRRYQTVLVVHHVAVPGGRGGFLSAGRTFNRTYSSYEKTYTRTTITKVERTTTSKTGTSTGKTTSRTQTNSRTTTRGGSTGSRSGTSVRSGRR